VLQDPPNQLLAPRRVDRPEIDQDRGVHCRQSV
jgi:hypothetical protein